MSKYFVRDRGNGRYFSDTATSSGSTKLRFDPTKRQASTETEPRAVLEKAIADYGAKRSGLVQRRYGIK